MRRSPDSTIPAPSGCSISAATIPIRSMAAPTTPSCRATGRPPPSSGTISSAGAPTPCSIPPSCANTSGSGWGPTSTPTSAPSTSMAGPSAPGTRSTITPSFRSPTTICAGTGISPGWRVYPPRARRRWGRARPHRRSARSSTTCANLPSTTAVSKPPPVSPITAASTTCSSASAPTSMRSPASMRAISTVCAPWPKFSTAATTIPRPGPVLRRRKRSCRRL